MAPTTIIIFCYVIIIISITLTHLSLVLYLAIEFQRNFLDYLVPVFIFGMLYARWWPLRRPVRFSRGMQNLITVFSNQYAYAYDGVDCHEYIRGAPRIHVSFYVNSGIYSFVWIHVRRIAFPRGIWFRCAPASIAEILARTGGCLLAIFSAVAGRWTVDGER